MALKSQYFRKRKGKKRGFLLVRRFLSARYSLGCSLYQVPGAMRCSRDVQKIHTIGILGTGWGCAPRMGTSAAPHLSAGGRFGGQICFLIACGMLQTQADSTVMAGAEHPRGTQGMQGPRQREGPFPNSALPPSPAPLLSEVLGFSVKF